MPTCEELDKDLVTQWQWDQQHGWLVMNGLPPTTRYYGTVFDGGGAMRGCALKVPALVASGPTGNATGSGIPLYDLDRDGSYGDWYGAHELGRTWGRYDAEHCGGSGTYFLCLGGTRHGKFCADAAECPGGTCTRRYPSDYVPYPYANGQISGAMSGDDAFYGFDVLDRTLHGPGWTDGMTYCPLMWTSKFTFEGTSVRLKGEQIQLIVDWWWVGLGSRGLQGA